MNTIVLAAAEFETEPIARAFSLRGPKNFGVTKAWTGQLFTLVQTNIGKVHAAAVTQYVIDRGRPVCIINVGVSGGFEKKVALGDVVMPTEVMQYDHDQTKLGYPLGRIHNIEKVKLPLAPYRGKHSWKTGLCFTGDKLLSDKEEGKRLYAQFHPAVVDMELGAIVQVCYMQHIPVIALKSPVDIVEKEEVSSFTNRIEDSMKHLIEALRVVVSDTSHIQ